MAQLSKQVKNEVTIGQLVLFVILLMAGIIPGLLFMAYVSSVRKTVTVTITERDGELVVA